MTAAVPILTSIGTTGSALALGGGALAASKLLKKPSAPAPAPVPKAPTVPQVVSQIAERQQTMRQKAAGSGYASTGGYSDLGGGTAKKQLLGQ